MGMKDEMRQAMPERQGDGQGKRLLSRALSEIGAELMDQARHGSHEVAAALFRGADGFVMYPHEGKQPEHGLPQEPQKEPERGGIEM